MVSWSWPCYNMNHLRKMNLQQAVSAPVSMSVSKHLKSMEFGFLTILDQLPEVPALGFTFGADCGRKPKPQRPGGVNTFVGQKEKDHPFQCYLLLLKGMLQPNKLRQKRKSALIMAAQAAVWSVSSMASSKIDEVIMRMEMHFQSFSALINFNANSIGHIWSLYIYVDRAYLQKAVHLKGKCCFVIYLPPQMSKLWLFVSARRCALELTL